MLIDHVLGSGVKDCFVSGQPEQPDQVEDVAGHLDLLRSRLELFSPAGIAT